MIKSNVETIEKESPNVMVILKVTKAPTRTIAQDAPCKKLMIRV